MGISERQLERFGLSGEDLEDECCGRCQHFSCNRVVEDHGWGVALLFRYGYCNEMDASICIHHEPCDHWEAA